MANDSFEVKELQKENAQLKADYLDLAEKHQREIDGWAESLLQREGYIEQLKAELAQLREALQNLVKRNDYSCDGLNAWDSCWDEAKKILEEQ